MDTAIRVGETTFELPTDREIVIRRVVDAPKGRVFEAMTDPAHMPHWYGPRGWTLPECEADRRPGGSWRHVCLGPDGTRMGMRGVYREVSPPDRVVTTESFDDFPGESLNTLSLVEDEGGTAISVSVLYPSKEVRDAVIASGMPEGAAQTYDRLAEYLRTMG